MTEQENQAVETLARSFTRMETLYKVKCTEIEAKEEEISDLKAENASLRARLENAVELPCVKMVKPKVRINRIGIVNVIREWAVVYIDRRGDFVVEHCGSKTAAEARLEELKGAKNDG